MAYTLGSLSGNSIASALQLTVREELLPTLHQSLEETDDIFRMMFTTSKGVKKSSPVGRGYNVIKVWVTGGAGGAKFVSPLGGNVVSGTSGFNMYDSPQTFPSLDETTTPAYVHSIIQLVEHRGNYYVPTQMLQQNTWDSSIGDVVGQGMKEVANFLTHQAAAVHYSTDSTTYALAAIGDASVSVANKSGDTTSVILDFDATDVEGQVHRFRQGVLVDQYDSTGTTKRNSAFKIGIDNVDPIANQITLKRMDGATLQRDTSLGGGVTYAGTGCDDDVLVIADSVGVAPNSMDSWAADGTTVTEWFGIDVANFGQFKSYRPSAINAPLTESTFNRHFGFFYNAFKSKKLRTVITTPGAVIGFIDNLDSYNAAVADQPGRFRYDRQGQALDVEAGWDVFRYRYPGRPTNIHTSNFCAKGRLYSGDFEGSGIAKYVVAGPPGSRTDARFGPQIFFVAPLGGSGGIFKHAHASNGATTDFQEMPFSQWWNCQPVQPNMMVMTGITEILG